MCFLYIMRIDLICVYSTTATSTTPQFVITVTGLSDPLCFNLPLTSGKEYKLLDAARGSSGEKKKGFFYLFNQTFSYIYNVLFLYVAYVQIEHIYFLQLKLAF